MFSKSRINEPGPKAGETEKPKAPEASVSKPAMDFTTTAPKGSCWRSSMIWTSFSFTVSMFERSLISSSISTESPWDSSTMRMAPPISLRRSS